MAAGDPPGPYSGLPAVIDDDVQRTAELILRREVQDLQDAQDEHTLAALDPEARRKLLEAVCVALQVGLMPCHVGYGHIC